MHSILGLKELVALDSAVLGKAARIVLNECFRFATVSIHSWHFTKTHSDFISADFVSATNFVYVYCVDPILCWQPLHHLSAFMSFHHYYITIPY